MARCLALHALGDHSSPGVARRLAILKRGFVWIADSPRSAFWVATLAPVAFRLALLPVNPVPQPSIHDEFSQLLLGDTLAHGRLTNPTPALWQHFESIHIIQKPTYNSMYPPAQGVFLALGQKVLRQPWAGVELANALMCAAMYWMFLSWLPRRWALFGVFVCALQLTLVGLWVDSYISGAVPAIGGALIIGAASRFRSNSYGQLTGFLFGLGAVILMNSRPFEGGLLTLATLFISGPALVRQFRIERTKPVRQFALPAAVVLALGTIFLGYYCYRVTGHATKMPYQVNRETYGWPENLAFLRPKKIEVRDPVLRRMYQLEVSHHEIFKSFPETTDNLITRIFDNWSFLVGPALTLPLAVGFFYSGKRFRILSLLLIAMLLVNLSQLLLYPYHLAPVVPILFCLIAAGCRALYQVAIRVSPERKYLVALLIPTTLAISTATRLFADYVDIPPSSYWERGYEWQRDARADIINWLTQRPGKHLVIVRYASNHPVNQEWVYNAADLDSSKVIWAREVSEQSDDELVKHYSDRQAWLIQADIYPQQIVTYPKSRLDDRSTTTNCPVCSLGVRELPTAAAERK